jgi:hypothetical protein
MSILEAARLKSFGQEIRAATVTGSRAALYLSDLHAGTIPSEFNNTERDMDKLESQTSKEAAWRNHLARHAASGKSIAAFCRDEAISGGNFHAWRTKLRDGAV